ncbi:MAG: hypothetical protein KDI80_09320 [Xanthomonadales bacterium]|nr:hypothetical protein [Xanthomonadales bacterium]
MNVKAAFLSACLLLMASCDSGGGTAACGMPCTMCERPTEVLTATGDDGTRVSLTIDGEKVANAPLWNVAQGDPPLSLAHASQIAAAWASKHYGDAGGFQIREITLRSFGCFPKNEYWYYIVNFTPIVNGKRTYETGSFVAVLMDGSTAEPVFTVPADANHHP